MQAAKKAAETIKETAANIGASAKSGLEKTKATVQEKTEKMTAHDPIQKDMATEKKDERISQAELEKQEAREHNSAAKEAATAGHMTGAGGRYTTTGSGPRTPTKSATGEHGQTMWADQMSTMPEQHGLGQSATATHMEGQYSPTGPGATYSTTGERGQGQPMRANQMSSMPGQQEHGLGLGHGLGELADEMMVGSNPTRRNTGTGRTTAHNTHVGGTASAPAPGSGPGFR